MENYRVVIFSGVFNLEPFQLFKKLRQSQCSVVTFTEDDSDNFILNFLNLVQDAVVQEAIMEKSEENRPPQK